MKLPKPARASNGFPLSGVAKRSIAKKSGASGEKTVQQYLLPALATRRSEV
jgi:hypothetical protein